MKLLHSQFLIFSLYTLLLTLEDLNPYPNPTSQKMSDSLLNVKWIISIVDYLIKLDIIDIL
jgi:hypothetical protein